MNKNIIIYAIAIILVLIILVLTFFPNMIHAFRDSGASGEDKCAPPPGKTEQEWKEHMSHHPNVYAECL